MNTGKPTHEIVMPILNYHYTYRSHLPLRSNLIDVSNNHNIAAAIGQMRPPTEAFEFNYGCSPYYIEKAHNFEQFK